MGEKPELLSEMRDDGRIAILTLNRPERRNAFHVTLLSALIGSVRALDREPNVRAIVLRGAGPVFCAGMDLAEFAAGKGEEIIFESGLLDFVRERRETSLIGAIHGAAMAGDPDIGQLNDKELRRIIQTGDAREGALAFRERRAPQWQEI